MVEPEVLVSASAKHKKNARGVATSDVVFGSAGGTLTRTFFTFQMVVGLPFSRWGAKPFVTHPIPFPEPYVENLKAAAEKAERPPETPRHPIHQALEWQKMLVADPSLTMAEIAQMHGFSRARVSQIMSLLMLPASIQAELEQLTDPLAIRFFTERRLRREIHGLSPDASKQAFKKVKEHFAVRTA